MIFFYEVTFFVLSEVTLWIVWGSLDHIRKQRWLSKLAPPRTYSPNCPLFEHIIIPLIQTYFQALKITQRVSEIKAHNKEWHNRSGGGRGRGLHNAPYRAWSGEGDAIQVTISTKGTSFALYCSAILTLIVFSLASDLTMRVITTVFSLCHL